MQSISTVALVLAITIFHGDRAAPPADDRPALRIVSDATFPPFHYIGDGGVATGFDIELARLMADRAGFNPVILVRPYDQLLKGLNSGDHDLVAATTGVTPERELIYLFTTPYFETCQTALVRTGPGEPMTIADLRGRRIGATAGGTAERAARTVAGTEYVSLGDGQGLSSLEKKSIDAWIVDEFDSVRDARASSGRLQVLREPVALERYAFVLSKSHTEWKDKLNQALADLEREGRVAALQTRYGVARDAQWPVAIGR